MANITHVENINKSGRKKCVQCTVNCCTGCSNNCRPRYPIQFEGSEREVTEQHQNFGKSVMIPSSHSITPENLDPITNMLRSPLEAGSDVLIVTKPDHRCIGKICEKFHDYRDKILFRFVVGAYNNNLLSIWEPCAPSYESRHQSLLIAHIKGYQTSVSIEPMIDADHVTELVGFVLPYVTDTICIGKMNYLERVNIDDPVVAEAVEQIRTSQSDENIIEIYNCLKYVPQIRWKENIRDVINNNPEAVLDDQIGRETARWARIVYNNNYEWL